MTVGRKRGFDENVALDAAMNVFWQKGYLGASLSHLTAAMGINKPSMYSTFGNKQALFVKATSHYVESHMAKHLKILSAPSLSLRDKLMQYMQSVIAMQTEQSQGRGCYLVLCQSEIVSDEIPSEAVSVLEQYDVEAKAIFLSLFESDPESIEKGLDKNAQIHALTIYTVLKGAASMARAGVPCAQLNGVIDNTLTGIGL
ncbi:TetR/AcrR family transcriptional regulator [Alteromonas sp. 1_MG-2023]|uniref:TetR/AcrR family transcriptional regulator n=1 Tax=Alteromonas sp. 1_MG-2023 TaxID=3062669 RepID=UPI0026E27A50|nr:TetR/AcrR family transcriptional regulator [Alteromonas sp. 1_MG-2023]MDO6565539.1 TetR/AcrR family transcriptional regulator [Alteromonas sp. 1_MG-2023]